MEKPACGRGRCCDPRALTMESGMTFAKPLRRALEAPITKLGLALVPRFSRRGVLALSRFLGNAAYLCSARLRQLGLANLDLAFGDSKTQAEKRTILRKSMQNFSLVILDLAWFSKDSAVRMETWFEAAPSMKDVMGRSVSRVAVTGHFGNWELIGRYAAIKSVPLLSVALPLKNPDVEALLQRTRQTTGQRVIPREGALRKLIRFLKEGGTVAVLLDQNTRPEEGGLFAEFFGKPVTVSAAAGLLASMTRSEIAFAYALPRPDGSYLGEVPHVIPYFEIAGMDRDRLSLEITRRLTRYYEEAIRSRPECWLWSYKRWRHIPAGEPADGFPYYAVKLEENGSRLEGSRFTVAKSAES